MHPVDKRNHAGLPNTQRSSGAVQDSRGGRGAPCAEKGRTDTWVWPLPVVPAFWRLEGLEFEWKFVYWSSKLRSRPEAPSNNMWTPPSEHIVSGWMDDFNIMQQ